MRREGRDSGGRERRGMRKGEVRNVMAASEEGPLAVRLGGGGRVSEMEREGGRREEEKEGGRGG